MPQHLHRGAALAQHRRPDVLNASWEDLRAFLLCTRHQSFRNAAEVLGLTGTTLMRKIDRLEEELGFKLFLRAQSGLSLSDEGRALLFDVEQIERLSFNIFRRASLSTDTRGSVRVAVTEGPGNFWVLPRLIDFQKTYRAWRRTFRSSSSGRPTPTSSSPSSAGFTSTPLSRKPIATPTESRSLLLISGITASSSSMACSSTKPVMHGSWASNRWKASSAYRQTRALLCSTPLSAARASDFCRPRR